MSMNQHTLISNTFCFVGCYLPWIFDSTGMLSGTGQQPTRTWTYSHFPNVIAALEPHFTRFSNLCAI